MYTIYLLLSISDDFRYIGFTDDTQERLHQHNLRRVRSTKAYAPFAMIGLRRVVSSKEARRAEKYFKSGFGRRALDRALKAIDTLKLEAGQILDLTDSELA